MKAIFQKAVRSLWKYFNNDDVTVSKWSGEMLEDFYASNLSHGTMAAAMLCTLSLISLCGFLSPYRTASVLTFGSPAIVYLVLFVINALFLAAFRYVTIHRKQVAMKDQKKLFVWFSGINMILASTTFFATQKNSGFFFEYVLVTIIVLLLTNSGTFSFFRNMLINLTSVVVVLVAAKRQVAWQDIVDIAVLMVVCAFVNYSRLQSFLTQEKEKLSTEKKKNQYYHDSRTDELTNVANRMALRADFPAFLNRPLCVALIDLDDFRKSNDIYGHAYGDRLLKKTGSCLTRIFQEAGDHCYRYGGDEFLVISEKEDPKAFRTRLESLLSLCGTSEDGIEISCRIGYYADTPRREEDLLTMINNADHYLYQAKSESDTRIEGRAGETKTEDAIGPATDAISVVTGRDPLTGLPDMRTFLDTMRQYRKKEDGSADKELAVLYFDLINFRMINLMYGMAYGDDTLKKVGESLRESFRGCVLSHWDVDRFAVLTNTMDLDRRATNALRKINSLLPLNAESSVGACVWEDHALDAETICNRAKAASDESRKKVGLHFAYYTKAIGESLTESVYVVSHIDEAIEKGWIVVYYQPVVRALTNEVCGMEALARWKDPERGLLPPIQFIKPLEDARLIYKLDLCVIRQAVKETADRYAKNLPEVPLSINLSRLDFLCCDIYQEIEALVQEYDIPRRMLHIEVTESIMRSEDGAILRALQSFRSAGYELWMDDFGSGYSTLNLLKDYSFDVLKLDMAFLRSDTSRSRSIIVSVIEMDKGLGIRTLAEGVETKEQVEFLRRSGCEKLQGYYFSKPLPFDEALKNCLDKGVGIESVQKKICFDSLSHVDFLTDVPLLISEIRDQKAALLFANEAALRQFRQDGFENLASLEDALNNEHNAASRELAKAVLHAEKPSESGETTTLFNGNRRLIRYQMLGTHEGARLYVSHIYGRSAGEDASSVQNQLLMNLTYYYRNLFAISATDMTIQSLRFVNRAVARSNVELLKDPDGHYASVLPKIFEADQESYNAFIDPATLLSRLQKAKYGILHAAFRTEDEDGTYTFMSHRLLLVPNAGKGQQILYVIHTMDNIDVEGEPSSKRVPGPREVSRDLTYYESLMRHIPLPVFWKDRDRRFLGANQAFLDYYGFSSVHEILGKTDEDMKWHPNNEIFKEAEDEVLRSGQISKDVPGKCISRGVARSITATKWPTYEDGKISGLMGYFIDPDAIPKEAEKTESGAGTDIWPRGLRAARYMQDLADYQTDYRLNHKPFGVLYIRVPELVRIADTFGHATMHAVSWACEQVIRDTLQQTGICESLDVGAYAVMMTLSDDSEMQEKAERIRKGINDIHEVDGVPCTLYAKVRALNAEEVMRMNEKVLSLLYPADTAKRAEGTDEAVSSEGK